MTTLKERAKEYEPKQTYNIAELNKVSVDIEIEKGEGQNKEGETFDYLYTKVDGNEYRVPYSVLTGMKVLLEKMPDLSHISVIRQGVGMNTTYQVIPLGNEPTKKP